MQTGGLHLMQKAKSARDRRKWTRRIDGGMRKYKKALKERG